MAKRIRKVEKKMLDELSGFEPIGKESWWLYASMQDRVNVKERYYKAWHLCENVMNWENYKIDKKA